VIMGYLSWLEQPAIKDLSGTLQTPIMSSPPAASEG